MLEGGRHDDASDHLRKTVPGVRPSDKERAQAEASKCQLCDSAKKAVVKIMWYALWY